MTWTDNPIRDFERYDAELNEREQGFPLCSVCKEVVYDDYVRDLYGNIVCENCLGKE